MNDKHTVGTVINSTLIQRNGGSYKLVDARDIDFAKAEVFDQEINNYEDLITALNNMPASKSTLTIGKLNKNVSARRAKAYIKFVDLPYITKIDSTYPILVSSACYKLCQQMQDLFDVNENNEIIDDSESISSGAYVICSNVEGDSYHLDVLTCPDNITITDDVLGINLFLPYCAKCSYNNDSDEYISKTVVSSGNSLDYITMEQLKSIVGKRITFEKGTSNNAYNIYSGPQLNQATNTIENPGVYANLHHKLTDEPLTLELKYVNIDNYMSLVWVPVQLSDAVKNAWDAMNPGAKTANSNT